MRLSPLSQVRSAITGKNRFPVTIRQIQDVKVVQELLRHASTKVTLDVYAQALTPAKRAAQRKVVLMIRGESQCTASVPRATGDTGISC